jgi:hypothetical protein
LSAGTGTRYPANVTEFARRLYQDEGYRLVQVIEALGRRGITPARSTVLYWCDPDARTAHNVQNRTRMYPHGRQRRREASWSVKLRRMRELRGLGLSFDAVRRVANHEFGTELDADAARRILTGRVSQRTIERLLAVTVDGEGEGR